MAKDILRISYSRASLYRRCPQAHYYRYTRRIQRKRVVRALSFGTDLHKMLEVRADKKALKSTFTGIKEKYEALSAEEQELLGDTYVQDIKHITQDYMRVYRGKRIPHRTEQKFSVPISHSDHDIRFIGVIDEVYLTGLKHDEVPLVGDHKTFSRKPDASQLIMNTQSNLYAKAFELTIGYRPEAFLWDYIRSTPAKAPAWLTSSGRFSEAASNDITPFSYLRACKERGIEIDAKVKAFAGTYEPNISNFFFQVRTPINWDMVESIYKDFARTARNIAKMGDKNQTKHVDWTCRNCEFHALCMAQFGGADIEYVIEKEYMSRPDDTEFEAEDES